jgi:single-strand DNA-binding protein
MAGSLNKVILIGHLGQDPKLSYAQSGLPIANLRMATSERIKDRTGQQVERTEWHTVVVFDKQAEFCGNYLNKGALIMVEGRLQTRKWQDKDGQDRYSTEVVAQRVQSLGSRSAGQGAGEEGSFSPRQQRQNTGGQQPQQQQAARGGQQNPPFHDDEDLGPAFPSEASGMDDVPF